MICCALVHQQLVAGHLTEVYVVLTCLLSRSRQASCLELCNPQHPSTTL
jgi:hypothetical protein